MEEKGCAAIETGEVLGDDGTFEGQSVSEHLIEVGERLVIHHLINVCPDEAPRQVVSASCRTDLREGIDAPIRGEQAIEAMGLQFLDLLFVTLIPRRIDASMGEEIALMFRLDLISQLEVGAMRQKELLENVGKILIVTAATSIAAEAVGGIMQVVIAQQEHHPIRLAFLELKNLGKILIGLMITDAFRLIGINIVAQEDDGVVVLVLHGAFPESASVNIGDDE